MQSKTNTEAKVIKNVVFDVGNVIVRWAPLEIARLTFGEREGLEEQARQIFQSDIWQALNKGRFTEAEAKQKYQDEFHLSKRECECLFYYVKHTQLLIYGTVDLIKRLKKANYRTFALTDNMHEIVEYLQTTYDFWTLFEGAVVSADVGLLKPQPEIYQTMLDQFELAALETVFIDDMLHNVEGAKTLGIQGIQFVNAVQCEEALQALGLML